MAFRALVARLSSLSTVTISTSWVFHFIISVFKLENCSVKKLANANLKSFIKKG